MGEYLYLPFDIKAHSDGVFNSLREKIDAVFNNQSPAAYIEFHSIRNELKKFENQLNNLEKELKKSNFVQAQKLADDMQETLQEMSQRSPRILQYFNNKINDYSLIIPLAREIKPSDPFPDLPAPLGGVLNENKKERETVPTEGPLAHPLTSLGVIINYNINQQNRQLYKGFDNDLAVFPVDRVPLPADANVVYSGDFQFLKQVDEDFRYLQTYDESKLLYPEWINTIKQAFGPDFRIPVRYSSDGNRSHHSPFDIDIKTIPSAVDFDKAKTNPLYVYEALSSHISSHMNINTIEAEHVLVRKRETLDEYVRERSPWVLAHELGHMVQFSEHVIRAKQQGFKPKQILILAETLRMPGIPESDDPGGVLNDMLEAVNLTSEEIVGTLKQRPELLKQRYIIISSDNPYYQERLQRMLTKAGISAPNLVLLNRTTVENDAVQRYENPSQPEDRGIYADAYHVDIETAIRKAALSFQQRGNEVTTAETDSVLALPQIKEQINSRDWENYDTFKELVEWLNRINVLFKDKFTDNYSLDVNKAGKTLAELTQVINDFAKEVGYDEGLKQKLSPELVARSVEIERKLEAIQSAYPTSTHDQRVLGLLKVAMDIIQTNGGISQNNDATAEPKPMPPVRPVEQQRPNNPNPNYR